MAKRNIPAGIVALGFQTITSANSTAVGLNTTCIGGKFFHFSVETQNARYRNDGTAPAATTGVLLVKDKDYFIEAPGANLKFIKVTGGTSKISVMAYKYKGE